MTETDIMITKNLATLPPRKMSDEAIQQRYNPDPVVKFDTKKAKRILHDALDKKFSNWNYDPAQASAKARECSKYVFNQLQSQDQKRGSQEPVFNVGRYKCICQVYCMQLAGQGVRIATRELWNPNTDNLICETMQGKDYVAVGLFWYIYIE